VDDAFSWLEEQLVAKFGLPAAESEDNEMEQRQTVRHPDGVCIGHEYSGAMNGGHYVYVFV